MDSERRTIYEPSVVPHPGDTVVEYLEFHGWSQRDLARRTGLTPKTISEICNGKAPITPATSLALEKVFQRPAHLWLNLQRQFDEAVARRRESEKSVQWKDWVAKFPLKEMKRFKFISPEKHHQSDTDALLSFLGVSSPESWNSVWQAAGVAYRQTRKFKTSIEAVSVWVRATELAAAELPVADFNEKTLRSSVDTLRRYTRERVQDVIEQAQKLCAAAGVALVWVPEFQNTGISGCARWLSDNKALIALTLRYKTDDQMWFTLFHELGHILLHSRKHIFVLDNAVDNISDRVVDPQMQQYEDEANRFSADTLIPPHALEKFIRKNDFGNEAIHNFAEEIGIGPGIVVGRLQHEGLLQPYQGNALKQTLQWNISEED
ncbi:HigA family addiction module antitoxin [Sorangium sp. So ce1099]|uniref:HigA family addiction module antitoxin n=1 Tax=Sorangium sp. So ce1099 TaxID=3133331 RepID=UPI003F60133F